MRESDMKNATIHPVLAELPVFAPEADLWPRIRAAHATATAAPPRRARPAFAFAAAAAIAVVVAGTLMLRPRLQSDAPLVEGQRESQTLEREWQALPSSAPRPAAGLARLHVIDTALQAAYDRGAEAEELQPLWQQRNDALRGLIMNARVSARAEAITRI